MWPAWMEFKGKRFSVSETTVPIQAIQWISNETPFHWLKQCVILCFRNEIWRTKRTLLSWPFYATDNRQRTFKRPNGNKPKCSRIHKQTIVPLNLDSQNQRSSIKFHSRIITDSYKLEIRKQGLVDSLRIKCARPNFVFTTNWKYSFNPQSRPTILALWFRLSSLRIFAG